MIPLSLAQIAEITGATLDRAPDPHALVTGPVVIDSREAKPDGLFAALPGERVDGHDFAGAAVAAGAVAVLASQRRRARARCPRRAGRAGAAGSRGDRPPARAHDRWNHRLIRQDHHQGSAGPGGRAARAHGGAGGSFNNELGHPLTVLRADDRTRYLVLELGARGRGHIARLCAIAPPRLGAVLNVGRAHVGGYFADQAEVAQAKGELVEALPADGVAVLNADDPAVIRMTSRTAARVITFGRAGQADVRAADVTMDAAGRASFTLVTPVGTAPVRLNLRGEHNVSNALAAAALAGALGMTPADAADALSAAVARSKGRMDVMRRPDGVQVINDAYNANPESMRAALTALASMANGGRAFAVLGQMAELGGNSQAWHEEVGAFAARAGVSGLVIVGEQATPMLAGAKSVPGWRGELLHVPDGPAAAAALAGRIRPGDTVLVKASRAVALWEVAFALASEGTA